MKFSHPSAGDLECCSRYFTTCVCLLFVVDCFPFPTVLPLTSLLSRFLKDFIVSSVFLAVYDPRFLVKVIPPSFCTYSVLVEFYWFIDGVPPSQALRFQRLGIVFPPVPGNDDDILVSL
jgi:hypothetical protein